MENNTVPSFSTARVTWLTWFDAFPPGECVDKTQVKSHEQMLSELILVVEPSVVFVEMNCLGAIQWPCPKPRSTHRSGVLCAESQRHRELESKRNEAFRRVHGFLEQLGTSIFRLHTTDTGCHITFCLQLGCYASRGGKVCQSYRSSQINAWKRIAYDPLDETAKFSAGGHQAFMGRCSNQLRFWWHSWGVAGGIQLAQTSVHPSSMIVDW